MDFDDDLKRKLENLRDTAARDQWLNAIDEMANNAAIVYSAYRRTCLPPDLVKELTRDWNEAFLTMIFNR